MPESRSRPGHHPYQQPSDIPASQRTKGRITWGILLAVFGVLVAYFTAGDSYGALIAGGLVGFVAGYAIGKSMEKDAKKKEA